MRAFKNGTQWDERAGGLSRFRDISLGGLLAAAIASSWSDPSAQAADIHPAPAAAMDFNATLDDHVRDRDLSPEIRAQDDDIQGLTCSTLRDGAAEPLGSCAQRAPDGSYLVSAQALKQLDFGRGGLATIFIRNEGYAYVRRYGRALLVPTFDNSPDEFNSGLTRVRIGEKLGYSNLRLRVIIPAIYDGAYPFTSGRAWVCIGCVSVSNREHSFYEGGTATCIDQRGRKRPDAECGQGG